MKYIKLNGNRYRNRPTKGYALVDDDMFDKLSQYKWTATKHRKKSYVACDSFGKRIYMHRIVANTPVGKLTDHIDGNGWNNQKNNLRVCTNSENLRNRGATEKNRIGYKGVDFHKASKKYRARITVNDKQIYLGIFMSPESAYETYKKASHFYHKTFSHV